MSWIEYRLWSIQDRTLLWPQAEEFAKELEIHMKDHLWFNDSLYFEPKSTAEGITFLYGKIYDDHLEDEYFVVKLLLFLSNLHKDLAIQIQDSDGEFLLYEGADFIPKWITPSCQANRVFLHKGTIHFIPKTIKTPSIKASLQALREGISEIASKELHEAIVKQCEKPQQLHRSKCTLPQSIVNLLAKCPQCISLAISALKCFEEEAASGVCSFPFALTPTATSCVTFTRSQFAILSASPLPENRELKRKYTPTLPHHSASTFPQALRGMKLAFAFAYALSKAPMPSAMNATYEYSCRQFFQSQLEYRSFEALKMLNEDLNSECILQQATQEEDDDSWLREPPKESEKNLQSIFEDFALSEEEHSSQSESTSDDYTTTSDECSLSEGEYEVLETIFNDAELLQKIIERNSSAGADEDTQFLIQQLDALRKAKKE